MVTILMITGVLILSIFIIRKLALAKMINTSLEADHENVVILNDTNFDHHLKDKIMLVDFWASWCMPCRVMAPVLNEVAGELNGTSRVGKINIEVYHSLAGKYNVRSIPTLILFKDGKEINRFVGIKSKDFLLKEVTKLSPVSKK